MGHARIISCDMTLVDWEMAENAILAIVTGFCIYCQL